MDTTTRNKILFGGTGRGKSKPIEPNKELLAKWKELYDECSKDDSPDNQTSKKD